MTTQHPLFTSKCALALAQKINDPATPNLDRALACVQLSGFAELANMVYAETVKATEKSEKPEFVWHNGARVRAK